MHPCWPTISADIWRACRWSARRDTAFYRVSKQLRRNRKLVLVALVAMIVGTSAVMAWNYLQSRARGGLRALEAVPLTSYPGDEAQPSFSPDGRRLAFVWGGENNDNPDIYLRDVAGTGLTRLTTNQAEDVSPTWSPDGERIAFLRMVPNQTEVFVSPAAGGVHGSISSLFPTRIEAIGRHLDWSSDGKYLAAADKDSANEPFSIVLIESRTGHKIQITNPPAGMIGDMGPAFSPDGKAVAFIRAISSGVNDIYIVPIDGGETRRITSERRYIISLAWTADGRSIVFSSNRMGPHALWRVGVNGGPIERMAGVAENASDPAFSRDGKKLAFSQFYIDANIWRLDLQSGEARPFIASTQYDSSPHYSPDGSRIAFRSSRSGRHEIWVADANNPVSARQLTRTNGNLTGSPRWSPDGTRIACDSRPDGPPDIFVVNVATGEMKRITTESSEDVVPSWSNDGQWIYFASNRTGTLQIWKAPAAGGAAQQVTQQGGFAGRESNDGKYIYYAKGRTVAGLWRVPVGGGAKSRCSRG